ncbi:hypothetical protein VTK56DRAFT_1089 [Thermocarpiscus australiensis]
MRVLPQPARILDDIVFRRIPHAMASFFPIYNPQRYAGASEPVKRPKEFACFSYDKDRKFHLGDSALKWYYPPYPGADLTKGFESFVKHDDRIDEHLDSLLKTIAHHEQETGKAIDANIVTWRGMLTKIMAAPYETEGFEMNATLYRDCIFIEEHHQHKLLREDMQAQRQRKGPALPELWRYMGYKFETLSTLPRPWGEVSRDYIENRDNEIVNNNEQYCSVVRTGFGKTIVCLGGEVDAIWDCKPETPGDPINWVELKTSDDIRNPGDQHAFDRKLMKIWIQSFLLGVPKVIVGFRSRQDGILRRIQEFQTMTIPYEVQNRGLAKWDGNVCIKFTSLFLEWLRVTITDEGVWRISRAPGSDRIEVTRVEEVGHGEIITDDFMNWRIKLELGKSKPPDQEPQPEQEPEPESEPPSMSEA